MNRKTIGIATAAAISAIMLGGGSSIANAAEITVLSVGALKSSMMVIIADFEKSSRHKVKVESGAAGPMVARIQNGEVVDVAVVTAAQLEKLVSQGKVVPGTQVKVGKIGMGLAASKSVAKADISSMDAFKHTLVAAKSIGHTDPAGGASSAIYAAKMLGGLDIAEEIKPKIKIFASNAKLFEALSKGDVELGFGQMTEILAASQVTFVGPLPAPIQNYSLFAAGVVVTAKEPDAGKAFVQFLTSPSALAVMKAKGVESP